MMTSRSFGDKLSNTDPISNAVIISGLRFDRDFANLMLPGRFPISIFGSYVHESIHHFCFRSPVGTAISYLYLRAFLNITDHLNGHALADLDEYDILDDICRVETALYVMRPFSEGLALFGEFDAWPGDSKSLFPVFLNTAISFAEQVEGWQEMQIPDLLLGVLARARHHPNLRLRKENLLMQGFTTRNGGYLPGYHMVRNLQFTLIQKSGCDLLFDTEFYLSFLIHWVFGDFELVKSLLDEEKLLSSFTEDGVRKHDSANAIVVAFQKRISGLFELTADDFMRFDETRVSRKIVPWPELELGMSTQDAIEIENNLMTRINSLVDFSIEDMNETQRTMRSACYDHFYRRDYLCIGSFREKIRINNEGRIVVLSEINGIELPIIALQPHDNLEPYEGEAVIDVFHSGRSNMIFYAISIDGKQIVVDTLPDNDFDEERERLKSINLSSRACAAKKELMKSVFDLFLESDEVLKLLIQHYREQSDQTTNQIYRNWCGALMSTFGKEVSISEDKDALFDLCGRDPAFLRVIASLGVNGPAFLDQDRLDRECANMGMKAAEFVAKANVIAERSGFSFLIEMGSNKLLTI